MQDQGKLQFQAGLRSRKLTDEDWQSLLSLERKPSVSEIEEIMAAGGKPYLRPDGTMVNPTVRELLSRGELIQTYQQEVDASIMNGRSFIMEWEGLKWLALNTVKCNSLTFAARDIPETGHDALLGFYWNGMTWCVSLYHAKHRKDLDLSPLAAKYGGGGHRGACGFNSKAFPFVL